MNIGLVLDDTLDSSDGVQQYVLLLGWWLASKGNEVHYICGQTTRQDIANIHSLSKNVRARFNKNILSVPLPARGAKIDELLKTQNFDVLHVQMPFSPALGSRVIRRAPKNTAVVATFHIAPHGKLVANANKLLGRVQQKTLERLDSVVSVSKVAQDFAKTAYNLDSTVIPNAIDVTSWKRSANSEPAFKIVFLGRLVERKGCIYLLRALKKLSQTVNLPNHSVAIAGDGPERKELERYAREAGLSSIVDFKGRVTEEQKRELLQQSMLAVFPATGGESFGIVLIEAMAAGCTVLVGNNPGYAGVMSDAKEALFSPHDTKALSLLLEKIINDKKHRNQLHTAQQNMLQQFDINTVGDAILKVYKQAQN